MLNSQFTEKDKQIEYINQYYDQLRQEKLSNKKTIEEAIRRQNFDCDQIQNMKSLNIPRQRDIEPPPRNPTKHHELHPSLAHPRFELQSQNPMHLQMNQPIDYRNPAPHHQEIDTRYHEYLETPQNYYEKSPIEVQHEMRPFNRFPQGDHRYIYNPQSDIPHGHFAGDQYALPRPRMYCGDQNISNFNQISVQKAPCICQCNTKIPVRVISMSKNRSDEQQGFDLRNQWLDIYNNARMERKNNIRRNR